MAAEVEGVHKAFKGIGTDEKALIRILARLDPIQVNSLRMQYQQRFMKDLVQQVEKETSGYFRQGLLAIVRGPLTADAVQLHEAIKGLGTKESMLNDVLIGRSNADMEAIKAEYHRMYRRTLEADLRGDLSAATEQLFVMIAGARRAEESAPVMPHQTEADVRDLQRAMGNMVSKDAVLASQILTSRSDAQLRAMAAAYSHHFHRPLDVTVKDKFSGHMRDALLLLLARATNRPASDAEQLEASMAGIGTKDVLLVGRVVRAHWSRPHMGHVRAEFHRKYNRDLVRRIKGETSGDYERLMVACVE